MCCFTRHHHESSLMCGEVLGLHAGWELEKRCLMKDHRVQGKLSRVRAHSAPLSDPLGSGSPPGNSFHQDCFLFPQDRRLSCCSPPSPPQRPVLATVSRTEL